MNGQRRLCISSHPHLTTLVRSEVSFSNLKQLSIKDCHGLKYLFTSSTARKLVHLEELYVVQCKSMEEIFAKEPNETTLTFERLTTIILDSLSSLTCFYSGHGTLQLSSLIRVLIWKCPNMKIFSRGNIDAESFMGIQVSLDPKEDLLFHQDLNTTVEHMFERGVRTEFLSAVDECFSDNFELHADWHGKVDLQNKWLCNLVTLKLHNFTLPYAIPSSILPYLKNLAELEVWDSDKVEVIFDMNDTDILETASQLKKLTLKWLSELTHVWKKNSQVLIFQNLQEVVVSGCENLLTLLPASLAKNLEKLEKLEIESCHRLQGIVEKEEGTTANVTEKFVFPRLEKLDLCDLPKVSYFYLHTFTFECPALNKLSVLDCHGFELFTSTSINRQPLISNLKVISNLKKLRLDWKHVSALSLRFTSEQFVEGLNYLEKISLFFDTDKNEQAMLPIEILQTAPNLIEMSINCCNDPGIFRSQNPEGEDGMLGHLKILTLSEVCGLASIESMNSSWLNIFCEKLHELNVSECPYLTTLTLYTPTVSFSCLKEVFISKCPGLLYLFTPSAARNLINLEKITVKDCESVKEIVTNYGDATSKAIKLEQLNTIVLHSLQSLRCFYSGSNTLQLSSLINVFIWQCPNIEIFSQGVIDAESFRGIQTSVNHDEDLLFRQDLNATVKVLFQIQLLLSAHDLDLAGSPLLQEIWHGSVWIPELCFSYLYSLTVDGCQFLSDAVLPFNLLPSFTTLKTLKVQNCDYVKTIFDVKRITQDRMTFSLKKLTLSNLPKLDNVWNEDPHGILSMQLVEVVEVDKCKCLTSVFPASVAKDLVKLEKLVVQHCEGLMEIVAEDNAYPRGTNLEELTYPCPCVRSLKLKGLPKFKYFYYCSPLSDMLKKFPDLEPHTEDQVCIEKPNLQCLLLGENGLEMIKRGEFQRNLLHKLQVLTLCLESDVFPYEILQLVPNIEKLGVCDDSLKEIFCRQSPNVDDTGFLSQLKVLRLEFQKLASIALDNSWTEPFLRNLDMLKVIRCFELKSLVPCTCTVSFSNLTFLEVQNCNSLLCLFTSSTARSLTRLKRMEITWCDSIEEIVSKEGDESNESEQIIFEQLQVLYLEELGKLRCFYPGNLTLRFPSLEQVHVIKCPWMKTFSPANIIDHSTEWFSAAQWNATPQWKCDDLNLAVRRTFEEKLLESARREDHLNLADSPLQEIWHGSVPILDLCFRYLYYLTVDGCQFLSDAVLPFNLLPLFTELEKLEVRNCNYVKTIFDVKRITQDRIMTFSLEKLTLSRLPKLENVWNEDPHGIPSMQLLQEVSVDNCKCLTSVFPASVAKDLEKNLKNLALKDCEGLTAIVAEDNADPRGTNLELTFPCVTSLVLSDLPNFKFNGTTFELTPNVEHLTLGENELKMILRGEFQGNHLHKLKVHTLCFRVESNVFLQQVHNVEQLEVCDDSFKEILYQPKLKVSCFESLGVHVSIGLENSWIEPFLRNLETLEVISSFSSENLVPSMVSFSNLTDLKVDSCSSLLYLFTYSTATSLAQLKTMKIIRCKSIEEIVSKEGDESHENVIIFQQLNCLNLEYLPNLTSFYRGSLSFPSLEKLSVIDCGRMETLCPGTVKADKLFEVKLKSSSKAVPLEIDLNSTMRKAFLARADDESADEDDEFDEDEDDEFDEDEDE